MCPTLQGGYSSTSWPQSTLCGQGDKEVASVREGESLGAIPASPTSLVTWGKDFDLSKPLSPHLSDQGDISISFIELEEEFSEILYTNGAYCCAWQASNAQ